MRLIDADAFDKCLEQVEIEATKSRKYVFSSAINTIRGNLANAPTIEPQHRTHPGCHAPALSKVHRRSERCG